MPPLVFLPHTSPLVQIITADLTGGFPDATEAAHFEKAASKIKNKISATYEKANKRASLKLSAIDQNVFSTIDKEIIFPEILNSDQGTQYTSAL